MRWNDMTLYFLMLFLVFLTMGCLKHELTARLLVQKLILDRNLDTIAEDSLFRSVEGLRDDFEPIINEEYLQEAFQEEKEWVFGAGRVDIPVLFLVEKEQEKVYQSWREDWNAYTLSGYGRDGEIYAVPESLRGEEAIKRVDGIRGILEQTLSQSVSLVDRKKQYRFFIPYIEKETGYQKLDKTGFWYSFQSKEYRVFGRCFDFFTHSGSRSVRKTE